MFKLTRLEKSWILYDVGNSAFIMLVTTVMPIYFNSLAEAAGIVSTTYMAYWGYAASIATIIVALLCPIMGTLADTKNYKKRLFTSTMVIGVIACFVLGITHSWLAFLAIFVIGKVGFSTSLIFYDSMLSDITEDDRMDKVSSAGYAWGYIGSCIPFVISLALILLYDKIGLTFELAMALAFSITGTWWLVLTLPLLKKYKQRNYIEAKEHPFVSCFVRLGKTFKDIKKEKHIFLFLVGFFFYIDGVYTIIDMATAYGKALGLDSTGLLLALLVTQIVAFPSALLFGRLAQKYSAERLITVCISCYILIALYAISLQTQTQFWILAVCVGLFQGGIQALSRSYFAKIIPHEKSGEYFGLLDICGKGAAFIGTALVSFVTQMTGSANKGVSVISVLMVLGLIGFRIAVNDYHKKKV